MVIDDKDVPAPEPEHAQAADTTTVQAVEAIPAPLQALHNTIVPEPEHTQAADTTTVQAVEAIPAPLQAVHNTTVPEPEHTQAADKTIVQAIESISVSPFESTSAHLSASPYEPTPAPEPALIPVLYTNRLILRPLGPDDFEAVHSWAGNPKNVRYMSWGPNTEEQTRWFLTMVKDGKDFAVVLKETEKTIGSCGIYTDYYNDTGNLGWILHIDYWKCGYGTELGGELIRYGFEDLKLRRIIALCAAENYGSYRIMEYHGMRREALRKKAFWARIDNEWIDNAEYAILSDEYFDTNNTCK